MDELDILFLLDAKQKLESRLNMCLMYFGLRLPQYRVLEVIARSGKITVSDLSRSLDLSRATVSVLITKLQKAGVVETLDNKVDKRSFYIRLTEAGNVRFRGAENAVRLVLRNLESRLSSNTIQILNDFARQVMKSRLD